MTSLPAPAASTAALVPGTVVRFVKGSYKGCRAVITQIFNYDCFAFRFLDGMGEGVEEADYFSNVVHEQAPVMTPEQLLAEVTLCIGTRARHLGLAFRPDMISRVLVTLDDEMGDGMFDAAIKGWHVA